LDIQEDYPKTLGQQGMMVDPAPVATLKGPALPFFVGADNLNLDTIDEDRDRNMWWLLKSNAYPSILNITVLYSLRRHFFGLKWQL
jgi:hypothetical protein